MIEQQISSTRQPCWRVQIARAMRNRPYVHAHFACVHWRKVIEPIASGIQPRAMGIGNALWFSRCTTRMTNDVPIIRIDFHHRINIREGRKPFFIGGIAHQDFFKRWQTLCHAIEFGCVFFCNNNHSARSMPKHVLMAFN